MPFVKPKSSCAPAVIVSPTMRVSGLAVLSDLFQAMVFSGPYAPAMPCGPWAVKALSCCGTGLIGSFDSSNVLDAVSSTLTSMSPLCVPGVTVVPTAAPPSAVLRLTVTARPAGAIVTPAGAATRLHVTPGGLPPAAARTASTPIERPTPTSAGEVIDVITGAAWTTPYGAAEIEAAAG